MSIKTIDTVQEDILTATSDMGLLVLDLQGRVLEIDPNSCRLLQREAHEWVGDLVSNFVEPEDEDICSDARDVAANGGIGHGICRLISGSQGRRQVALTASPLLDEKGRPHRIALLLRCLDGNGHSKLLRENELRHSYLVELNDALRPLSDPHAILNEACRVLGKRLNAARVVYTESAGSIWSVVGQHVNAVPKLRGSYRFDDLEPAWQVKHSDGVIRNDDVEHDPRLTNAQKAANGTLKIGAYLIAPIDKEGQPAARLVVHQAEAHQWTDLEIVLVNETAERTWAAVAQARAERARQEDRQRLQLALDAAAMGAGVIHLNENKFHGDAQFLKLFGLPPDGKLDLHTAVGELIHPQDLDRMIEAVAKASDPSGSGRFDVEFRIRRKNGDECWVAVNARTYFEGEPPFAVRIAGVAQDVTGRRRMEHLLRQKEEQYRADLELEVAQRTAEVNEKRELLKATMDSSQDMIQVFEAVRDDQGAIIDLRWILNNHAAEKHYGDVIGESLLERNPGVVQEGIFDTIKKVLDTGMPDISERHYEHEQFRGWFLQSIVKLGDGVVTTIADITESKKATELQQRAHFILDTIQEACYELDAEGRFTYVNHQAQEFFKKTAEEMIGRNVWEVFPDAEGTDCFKNIQVSALDRKEYASSEYISAVSGRYIELRATPTGNGCIVLFNDIEERKRAEQGLLQAKEDLANHATNKYNDLFNSIDQGFSIIEVKFDENDVPVDYQFIEVSPSFEAQTGISNAVGRSMREIAPELEDVWFEAYGRVAKDRKVERFEHHSAYLDRWYSAHAFPVDKPELRRVAVLFNDITALKRAQESKFFLASIVESSEDSIVTIDFNNVLTSWNKGAEKLYGYPAEEAIGKPLTMLTFPKDLQKLMDNIDRIKHSKRVKRFETVRIRKEGQLIDLDIEVSPVLNEAGEVIGLSTVARNITKRKRLESALSFLAEVSQDLVGLKNIGETMDAVGGKIAKHFDLSHCVFVELDEAEENAVVNYSWQREDLPKISGSYPIGEFWEQEFVHRSRSGDTMVINDTSTNALTDPAKFEAIKIGSLVTVPIIEEGKWQFWLGFYRSSPSDWRDDEVELMRELTTRIWICLERAHAVEALRESKEKYSALFAASPVPFMVLTPNAPDLTITAANDAYFTATQTTHESLVGRRLFDVFPDDPSRPGQLGSEALAISLERVLKTRTTDVMERVRYDLVLPDGGFEPHWWEAINAPMLDASGRVSAIIHQVTRVTELHYAEQAELEEQEHQAFLLRLSDALRTELSAEAIANRALRMLFDQLRLDRCYVGIYRLAEDIGDFPHQVYNDRLPPLPAQVKLSDFPQALKAASDRTLVINDVMEMESLSGSDQVSLSALGSRAMIAATLRKGENNPLWSIIAVTTDSRVWTKGEVSLVENVAERTWAAAERARAQEALRESETRLAAIFDALPHGVSVMDTDGRFDIANREMDRYIPTSVIPSKDPERGWRWKAWHPDGSAVEPQNYPGSRSLRGERVVPGMEMLYTPEDGDPIWTSVTAVPLHDEQGRINGSFVTVTDINERKKTEEAIRMHETRLQLALEAGGLGTFIWYPESDRTEADERALAILGIKSAEETSLRIALGGKIHPDDAGNYGEAVQRALDPNSNHKFHQEMRIFVSGGVRWVQVSGEVFFSDDTGKPLYMAGFMQDINARKTNEVELSDRSAQFKTIFDHSPIGMYLIDGANQVVFVNPVAQDHFGTSDEAVGYSFVEMLQRVSPPEAISYYLQVFQHVLETGVPFLLNEHEEYHTSLGIHIHITWRMQRVPLPDGRHGVMCYFQDVTEQVRARKAIEESREALRKSEARYRGIGEAIEFGVWMADENGLVTYVSPSLLHLLGMSLQDFLEHEWEMLHPEEAESIKTAWEECIRNGGVWDREMRFRSASGHYQPILSRGVPLHDERGRITGWVGINLDISHLKQAEDKLKEADRKKDEFLATLSHELRNPLAPLRNGLELLRMAGNDAAVREQVLGLVERQMAQMVRLIDDLMDVSRISRGKVQLQRRRVSLDRIVQEAVESSRIRIEAAGHSFNVRMHGRRVLVNADRARLVQVLSNLLNNAAKYTDTGGTIDLTVKVEDDEVVFCVQDNGIGIPKDKQLSLFDMFSQIHDHEHRSQGGLGIGLNLVKRLTELHGGSVRVHSEGSGKGSLFVVRLPIVVEHAVEEAGPDETAVFTQTHHHRVLVVDDNKDGATTLSILLKASGCEIRVAHDGEAALAAAAEFRPHVVLLDIGLPKMNGYEVAEAIRKEEWGVAMKLIAITGWGQEEDKRRSKEAGFDRHLVKPIHPRTVLDLIAEMPGEA